MSASIQFNIPRIINLSDEELKKSYHELLEWRRTGNLKEGIVKKINIEFNENNSFLVNMNCIEYHFLYEIASRFLSNKDKLINKKVWIIENHNNGGHRDNNLKYIGKAYDRVVTIVDKINNLYLTNFYMSEYKDQNNDYCYYGFLKVSREDFKLDLE